MKTWQGGQSTHCANLRPRIQSPRSKLKDKQAWWPPIIPTLERQGHDIPWANWLARPDSWWSLCLTKVQRDWGRLCQLSTSTSTLNTCTRSYQHVCHHTCIGAHNMHAYRGKKNYLKDCNFWDLDVTCRLFRVMLPLPYWRQFTQPVEVNASHGS